MSQFKILSICILILLCFLETALTFSPLYFSSVELYSNNKISIFEEATNKTRNISVGNSTNYSSLNQLADKIFNPVVNSTFKFTLPSHCVEFSRKYIRISFVNGIYHSEDDWRNITNDLETTFGLEVHPFYNPSSGNWIQDATKAGFDLVVKPTEAETAYNLALHLRGILSEITPHGRVLHIAHSGGAILTYLAAKHHLNSNETSRIDVITLGPGRSITRKYFKGGRLVNYYAKNDPVVLLDRRAGWLIKSGSTAGAAGKGKVLNWISDRLMKNTSYFTVRDAKHNTSFTFLDAILNHPILDHSMNGPTYRIALEMEAAEFRRRLEDMIAQRFKQEENQNNLIRLARKACARVTGLHHFWNGNYSSRPSLSILSSSSSSFSFSFSSSLSNWSTYYSALYSNTTRVMRKTAANITKIHGFFSKKYLMQSSTSLNTVDDENKNNTSANIRKSSVVVLI